MSGVVDNSNIDWLQGDTTYIALKPVNYIWIIYILAKTPSDLGVSEVFFIQVL